MPAAHAVHRKSRGLRLRAYLPLAVLVFTTLLAASAVQSGAWSWEGWMRTFMGLFLVTFSMIKLFDLRGFADGFQMYDLLAKPFRPWAFVYPFVELGLGLAWLSGREPVAVAVATIVLMSWGAAGVIRALASGLDVHCACMGTLLKVPLSTAALVEDLGMVAMAGTVLI